MQFAIIYCLLEKVNRYIFVLGILLPDITVQKLLVENNGILRKVFSNKEY